VRVLHPLARGATIYDLESGRDLNGSRLALTPTATPAQRYGWSRRYGKVFRATGPTAASPSAWTDATYTHGNRLTLACLVEITTDGGPALPFFTKTSGAGAADGFGLFTGVDGMDVVWSINGIRAKTPGANYLTLYRTYHLVGTYDEAALTLYINGQIIASTPLSSTIVPTASPLALGSTTWGGTGTSLLAAPMIWPRALSAVDVRLLAAAPFGLWTR
jgi:hypothetical protein